MISHPVADVDDARPSSRQLADQAEQVLGFARRQRRGRLVHHEDARPGVHGACDLDELLLRDRQRVDERVGSERCAQAREHVSQPRAIAARSIVPSAVAAPQFAADIMFSATLRFGDEAGSW